MEVPSEYKEAANLRTLGNYLRGSHGVKCKESTQLNKRVEYFKGGKLLECLVQQDEGTPLPKWPNSLPKITDRAVGVAVAELLLQSDYFHRSEKNSEKKKTLLVSKVNHFEESGYYTWMYEGSKTWRYLGTVALIACVVGFTLLPIWPLIAKKVLWYVAVTFLLVILGFCSIRFLCFIVVWIFGMEFWIFPNLFDESRSFYDSFKPFISLEKSADGQGYYRFGLVAGLAAFIAWVMTQPTEFDTYWQGQKTFIEDLYTGNLLADVAADHKQNIDKVRRVPTIEELNRADLEYDDSTATNNGDEGSNSSHEVHNLEHLEATVDNALNEEDDMEAILEELTRQEEEEERRSAESAR